MTVLGPFETLTYFCVLNLFPFKRNLSFEIEIRLFPQMLQLHNIFFCVQLLRMTSNGKCDMLQGIGIHSVYRHSPCYFFKGQAVTQCQWIKIQLVHLNLCSLYCIALNCTRLYCDKQFSMIAQFCRGSFWQNKPSQLPWLVWPIYSRQGCCLPLRK